MLRSLAVAAIALALTAPPVLAASKPAISLARTSKWEINYDEDSCHLLAKFGEGSQSTILRITRFQPDNYFDLTLYGMPVKVNFATRLPVEMQFGGQKWNRPLAMVGDAGKQMPLLIFSGLRLDDWIYSSTPAPDVSPAQEEAVNSISFKISGGKRYRLETGPMNGPMVAMRACTTDLVSHWGFDPSEQARLSQPPKPLGVISDWITSADFPKKALNQGSNGLVQFRLDIDETGKVSGCRILYRTNPDDFADLSCKLLTQRAKFSPALNSAGKAVRSFYVSKIRWLSAW